VGRDDPCPCGSGKKHNRCCGAGAGTDAGEVIPFPSVGGSGEFGRFDSGGLPFTWMETSERPSILSGDFGMLRGFLPLGTGIAETDLKSMPLLEDAVYILMALVPGPIKATETGERPKAPVMAWWEKIGQWREPDERLRGIFKPDKQAGAWGLLECRLQLMAACLLSLEGRRILRLGADAPPVPF